MAIRISCENRNRRRTVDLTAAKRTAAMVLRGMGRSSAEVNIVFLSDTAIRELNREYLGIDSPTDVISFHEKGVRWVLQGKGRGGFAGEIAISSDTAKRNAGMYGVSFDKEIKLLVIHGVLHLLGFKDYSARDRAKMRRKEDEFLRKAENSLQ